MHGISKSCPHLVRREVLTGGGAGGWDLSALIQQRYSRKLFSRPQTIWDVATSPPTLAQSRTRNWNKPSLEWKNQIRSFRYWSGRQWPNLSFVTSTLSAERSYLKYIPGVPWDPLSWSIGRTCSLTLYWYVVFRPVKPIISVGTISMKYCILTKSAKIICKCEGRRGKNIFTYICNLLVSLQWLDDPGVILTEAEFLNPVGEVVVRPVHEARHVGVGSGYRQDLPSSDMKVARHLVQSQRTVYSAGILHCGWLHSSFRHVCSNILSLVMGRLVDNSFKPE